MATVQAYEYTGGLAPGHPAASRGEPLSARLGPHLLGGIFDGLLRPLSGAPAWLEPGGSFADAAAREYEFTPETEAGAVLGEGASLGAVTVPGGIGYRVLVPPGWCRRRRCGEAARGRARARRRGDRDRGGHGRAHDVVLAGAAAAPVPATGSTRARRC